MHSRWLIAAWLIGASLNVTVLADGVVFQIGKSDRNFADLGLPQPLPAYTQAHPEDVHFVVGQSDPAKDFCGIQPGPVDTWAGSRQHPFLIEFTLADEPSGSYELKLQLVDTHASAPPKLRIDVNGSNVEQMLPAGTGDASLARPEGGKPRTLRFLLGAGYLNRGANRISLTVTAGSWLLYDAISLSRLGGEAGPALDVSVAPTIFFVERDGKVMQELRVSVSGVDRDQPTEVAVRAGVDVIGKTTLSGAKLGTIEGAAYIDETSQPRQLTVTVNAGKQSRTVSLTHVPQKKWHIYVAPSVHTDIGYTHIQSEVIAVQNRNTDLAIELVREFPLYHWNLESSWAAQWWFRDTPPARHKELIEAARERRVGIEAGYLNMLTGLCSEEELIRNLYYSARLNRLYGVPFESFTITDAPSHVWSVPSILAGAGIRCISVGVNSIRAPLFKKNIHLKSPFWWEGPDGEKVLTWFATGYAQAGQIGLNDGFDRMRIAVENDLARWNKRADYPYDAILLHGAYSDNVSGTKHIAQTITEYAKRYAYPKVTMCANNDFFTHIEKNFADKIPTVRGCGGSWWEDGAGSTAYETAINRLAHADVIAAETAWAVAKTAKVAAHVPQERFDTTWDNILLYDEHTWGAYNSITQPTLDFVMRQWAVKAEYATIAKDTADRLLNEALRLIGGRVDAPAGSLLVFNPSGRARGGVVEAVIPRGMQIVDESGPVPMQVTKQDLLVPVGVVFEARNVPPVGYRTYRLAKSTQPSEPRKVELKDGTLENQYYRVKFDPKTGGVASLIDKALGKELVDPKSPYKLGQLIYGHSPEEKPESWTVPDPNKVKFHAAEKSTQAVREVGDVFTTVRSTSAAKMFPSIEMDVVLYQHERRIDFNFKLRKDHTFDREAVYIAFPIAGAGPKFRYEIGGGNVRPNEDHFAGACRDWFSVQRWVTVNTAEAAVAWSPIDTPLITLCQLTPGNWLEELPITNGTIFAYVMNNYWFTNYKASQDGGFTFRYSMTSDHAIEPAAASLFGESVQAPMRAVLTVPDDSGGSAKLASSMSLCSVEPASVIITTVKPAEDGKGVILRLRETQGQDQEAKIAIKLPGIAKATRCDLVERDREPVSVRDGAIQLKLKANGMATLRLE